METKQTRHLVIRNTGSAAMKAESSSRSAQSLPTETIFGMAVSLAFWICLLFSAMLFAMVGLSPKFQVYTQLRAQFDANQLRLVALEQHGEQLQRVIDAIRTDKDFESELTRIEFDALRPGEEVIPVDVSLRLDAKALDQARSKSSMVPQSVWHEPFVKSLASHGRLRMALLSLAAGLVVVSFTWLQPAGVAQVSAGIHGCTSVWQVLRNRYVRQR